MNLTAANIKDVKFRKLSKKIVSEMKRLSIPGVSVGIWNKGREFTAGFGVTSVAAGKGGEENRLPMTQCAGGS